MKPFLCELRTTSMAPSGEAVGHWDDAGDRRAVLVRGAAPNETVRVRLDRKTRPARGELVAVLESSAARTAPPCAHVDACGGCDWMHLTRASQREQHVALARGLAGGADVAFHEAPRALGYRTRARLHARGGVVGYFGARSHEVVAVPSCAVLHPGLDAARASLGALLEGARGSGELQLALGAGGAPVADVRWSGDLPPAAFGRFEAAARSGAWRGFSVTCGDARRPAVIGDPTPWSVGADGAPLELAPGGFSQANDEVNGALGARVAELAEGQRVVELYAGAGNLTVLLARRAAVRAVEASEAACEAARRNLGVRELDARVSCADAATFELPRGTDLVVLDPPRTGAREACARIAATRSVRRVVYVSCDRATLARDAAVLASAFRVASVDVFEMFPHTSHAETVVTFVRGAR